MKRNILFLFLAVITTLTSCSDWLDVQPLNQQREKDIYTTYKGYQDTLTGCYSIMAGRSLYGDNLTMSSIENLACLWEQPQLDNLPTQYYLNRHDYTNDYTKSLIQTIYGGLYNVVVQANAIINNLIDEKDII